MGKLKESRQINTNRLMDGMVVKNYLTLCELLGDVPCYGNCRYAQKKEWGRYFDYKVEGHKYSILSVYDKPLPVGLTDNSVYTRFIEIILIYILSCQKSNVCHFFPSSLFIQLGMVNESYIKLKDDEYIKREFGKNGNENSEITTSEVKIIRSYFHRRLKDITASALSTLEKNGLICCNKGWAIKTTELRHRGGYVEATEEQEKIIEEAERKAMLDLNITDIWQAFFTTKKEEFMQRVGQYIHEYDQKYFGALRWTTIIYNKPNQIYIDRVEDRIKKELIALGFIKEGGDVNGGDVKSDVEEKELVNLCKYALNDSIIKMLDQYANNQIESAKNKKKKIEEEAKSEWGGVSEKSSNELSYLLSAKFKTDFNDLVNRFIKIEKQEIYIQPKN